MIDNERAPIYVTSPSLPPMEDFVDSLKVIWDNRILTNMGIFHERFESELAEYLGVKYLSLFANGTLALLTALQVLDIKGEVITTPFSFVATSHAMRLKNLLPVFSDIDPERFNLDPEKIEAAITSKTKAIFPVHIYGNPCQIEQIQKISDNYNLKLIYDAAHAFGVKVKGNSILSYGDLSIVSFHATKVFNTIEGGAIISHDYKTKKKIDALKDFGITSETSVNSIGMNGKLNELQAAFGLLQLKEIDKNIHDRKNITELYREQLSLIPGISLMQDMYGVKHNYSFFPILINQKIFRKSRDDVHELLKGDKIYCRRYFYPLITKFADYRNLPSSKPANLPVAERVSREILCLPIYPHLKTEDVLYISGLLRNMIGKTAE